jgi:hypothetical protein
MRSHFRSEWRRRRAKSIPEKQDINPVSSGTQPMLALPHARHYTPNANASASAFSCGRGHSGCQTQTLQPAPPRAHAALRNNSRTFRDLTGAGQRGSVRWAGRPPHSQALCAPGLSQTPRMRHFCARFCSRPVQAAPRKPWVEHYFSVILWLIFNHCVVDIQSIQCPHAPPTHRALACRSPH